MKKKTEIDLSIPDSFENVLKAVVRSLDEKELAQLKKETRGREDRRDSKLSRRYARAKLEETDYVAKYKILLEEADLHALIADGQPPSDAIGVEMLVEEKDGQDYPVTELFHKVGDKMMKSRIVAKLWTDHLEEYHPKN